MLKSRKNTIFSKLLLYFFPTALFPLILGILFIYFQAKSSLTLQIIDSLHSISIRQTDQIESYIRERYHAVKILSQIPDLIADYNKLEKAFLNERGHPDQMFNEGKGFHPSQHAIEDKKARPFLKSYLKEHSFADLLLISMNGDVIFSILQNVEVGSNLMSDAYRDSQLALVFKQAKTLLETNISSFDYFAHEKRLSGFIAAPIFNGQKFIGILAVMLKNNDLFRIVNDYKGLQITGEIVVASKVGQKAVVMAPSRFDKNAASNKKIKIGAPIAIPIQRAVQKETGSGLSIDYRGKEVLAYWTYLPSLRWGVVVKMDAAEAFAPISHFKEFLIYFAIGSSFLVLGIILFLSKQMSEPIVKLTQWIGLLAEKDLSKKIEQSKENEIGQLMTAFTEMTNQLDRSQKSLKESEGRLKSIIENATAVIFLKNNKGKYILINRQYEKLFNLKNKSVNGKTDLDIFPAEIAKKLMAHDQKVLEYGSVMEWEENFPHGDGFHTYLSVKFPVRNPSGEIFGIGGISTDITQRKLAENQLKDYASQLEKVNQDLQNFTYTASHDLQEPLRKFSMFTDLIRSSCIEKLDERERDYLLRMQKVATRMQDLINGLLDYSRMTVRDNNFEQVDLNQIVAEVIEDLEAMIIQTHGKVESEPLPSLEADGLQMRQLFQNLISNGLKFFRKDSPPRITIKCNSPREGFWEIRVKDNGLGFEEQYLEKIFKPFQRLETNGKIPGTGMGLAICEKIVTRHLGTICVQSKPLQGAEFIITLSEKQQTKKAEPSFATPI